MIYLAFDTDVWINLLKIAFEEDDKFHEIIQLLNFDEVSLIVPENIIKEFDRNVEKRKSQIITEIRPKLSPINKNSKIAKEFQKSDKIGTIYTERKSRVKELFDKKALRIPSFTDQIMLASAKRCVDCLAPNHRKDSMRDTINVFSIYFYLTREPKSNVHFVTENHEDYSESRENKEKLHPELIPIFKQVKIIYHCGFNGFYHRFLKLKLKDIFHTPNKNAEGVKKESIKKDSDFLKNLPLVKLILKSPEPSDFQIQTVLDLVGKDKSYKDHFFKNVKGTVWFNQLSKHGYFSAELNPIDINKIGTGDINYFPPIYYLLKLSHEKEQGPNEDYLERIVKIIDEVSSRGGNNYITWLHFIKILINFPNDKIPTSIFRHITIWLKESRFSSLTKELSENLLPKFLNEDPSESDIEKAEQIICHLFQMNRRVTNSSSEIFGEQQSYESNVDFYFLQEEIINKGLSKRIVSYCSLKPIYQLIDNLKQINRDYANGIHFELKTNTQILNFKVYISDNNLEVYQMISEHESDDFIKGPFVFQIEQFEEITETQLIDLIIKNLKTEYSIGDIISENLTGRIHYSLFDDRSVLSFRTIDEIDDYRRGNDSLLNNYVVLLKCLVEDGLAIHQDQYKKAVVELMFAQQYELPIFRRLALFFIGNSWDLFHYIFVKLIGENDDRGYFSDYRYEQEIRRLLKLNIDKMESADKKVLYHIISAGPKAPHSLEKQSHIDYWKLKWYSALKDADEFRDLYSEYASKLNKDHKHFDSIGKVQYRSGYISPLSVEELLQMTNREIADQINKFQPKGGWNDPEIPGFAENFRLAVTQEPAKFSNESEAFLKMPYIYAYHFYRGFREAWEGKNSYSWGNLLEFTLKYVSDKNFGDEQFKLKNDGWDADHRWVIGAVANLIVAGTRDDSNAFDKRLLTASKKILFELFKFLRTDDDFDSTNMNYPDYTLNSTEGQVLHALVNQALRSARIKKNQRQSVKWTKDIQSKFETTLNKGILDGYIIIGMYYKNFLYLDKTWLLLKLREFQYKDYRFRKGFFGGYLFGGPTAEKGIFELILPYYIECIEKKEFSESLIQHITSFIFWNVEEINAKGSIINRFVKNATPESIIKLLHFMWAEKTYQLTLKEGEKIKFNNRIKSVWKLVQKVYQNSLDEEKKEIFSRLSLLVFIFKYFTKEAFTLLKPSMIWIENGSDLHFLLEEFRRLISAKVNTKTAEYLGELLNQIPTSNHLYSKDQEQIKILVSVLYEQKQSETVKRYADQICSAYAETGQDFLNNLYFDNNS